jgi:hydroxymethylglutaryl-CoA lyase
VDVCASGRVSDRVRIIEVGPRDGLQNEPTSLSADIKAEFIRRLHGAGIDQIELTSFVNPAAVPQLADAGEVIAKIREVPFSRAIALVPNERGYERALASGVRTIEIFAAATEAFSQANLRATVDEAFARFEVVARRAADDGIAVRGALSVAFVCPFTGPVLPEDAIAATERLFELGCYEVAICDTIGRATREQVDAVLNLAQDRLPVSQLALHMHDTTGNAIAHVESGYHAGIRTFDAAVGGLGGCPFAPGAPGNVASEQVVDHFEEMGICTGVDATELRVIAGWIAQKLTGTTRAA